MTYLMSHSVCKTLFSNYIFQALALGWLKDYNYFCQPIDFSYSPKALMVKRRRNQSIRNWSSLALFAKTNFKILSIFIYIIKCVI